MQFTVITGMSGAGKSTVLKFLEDMGYFCVDNLPPVLIGKFAEICFSPESGINKVALGIDIRGGDVFEELFKEMDLLKGMGYRINLVFIDAQDKILVKRFKETRRKHPLVDHGRVSEGIRLERSILEAAKKRADHIIDTTNLLTRELKEEVRKVFDADGQYDSLIVTVVSFGFKYGIPADADLVFDVRFLPNPYYVGELRELTGNDREVSDFVMQWEQARDFMVKLLDMVEFLLPNYIKEGKNNIVIAIGCTGGKHRSVTLANALHQALAQKEYSVHIQHRDLEKDAHGK
ncbi:RNase adapter RapZ [Anaerotalea alkaliphila]|uniref:RNase adapter RapZ n=1 Tax=Anaerotalea alkaliphila TaxID=2662126 RepID=A0A7X5HV37_9FIRM|nr:RNase adapter RapZ [Anaerotalea alkaliphila]NDL67190.1 RNase adapter RapZ [Anaerotalea alkaliphila]